MTEVKSREVLEVEASALCVTCGKSWSSHNARGVLGWASTHANSRGHDVEFEQRQKLAVRAGEPVPQLELFEGDA